MDVKSGS